jgi:DNA-3-methyladenine glycosylase II
MSPRTSYPAAAAVLAERDPVMASLVAAAGPMRLRKPLDTHFAALVRSIVYQQLAGRAAAAIHGRLITALDRRVEPDTVLALTDEQMRAAGLSANKTASLRDLAAKVLDDTVVLDPHRLAREPDDEVIARLSAERGIGEWTAHMFLLFQLRRMDVWPTSGRPQGLRVGLGRPDADAQAVVHPGRAVAPVPVSRRLVLLAGGRDLRRGGRKRRDRLAPVDPVASDARPGVPATGVPRLTEMVG